MLTKYSNNLTTTSSQQRKHIYQLHHHDQSLNLYYQKSCLEEYLKDNASNRELRRAATVTVVINGERVLEIVVAVPHPGSVHLSDRKQGATEGSDGRCLSSMRQWGFISLNSF